MKRRITALVLVLMAVCLVFAGCSKPVKADISGYENEKITIEGLRDELQGRCWKHCWSSTEYPWMMYRR